ncbi:tryptophan 7-halogenase (plasmid) [Polymorphobacter sp. PAMC 29334]|uniref:tryptophan halogenase family protein n=1 Tax=Polymorphobacter sp. PAMC 29334 TaxID=2862331 RepID=UPI001C685CD9|nr:tryptophan halogenase family protein [Polymorphobacter sp. PAMC 29334]QYE37089.1 tryptophan 7-halogenase [Polymorphobacter sp. PAMC 29334]
MSAPAVVILGGGTAGWMTACLMARAWPATAITLIESPAIPTVGVGEGSTPQLRGLFAQLAVSEADWMPACDATFKTGISFHGWSREPGFASYFHPFASAIDLHTQPAFHAAAFARRTGHDVDAHPDAFFLTSRLAAAGRAPVAAATFPFEVGYGYHFDAAKLGDWLRDHAVGRGVVHRPARVATVTVDATGEVTGVTLDDGATVSADLFVDASGFAGVIARQAIGVRFLPFAANLFCNRAVAIPTPVAGPPAVHTRATALRCGWAWAIPLTSRIGNGYVYSSRFCSPDEAEAELRAHLGGTDAPARHLTMDVGRLETAWTGNCLAVGLAQGFIEPLEATALHLVQSTVEQFIATWEAAGFTPAGRAAFNTRIARRIEGIRDYIVAHYRMARRDDTAFWRANAANDALSDDLKAVITRWFTGGDVAAEVASREIGGYYAPMSWECLLAGYGNFPDAARLRPGPDPVDRGGVQRLLDGCLLNFAHHHAVLARLAAAA